VVDYIFTNYFRLSRFEKTNEMLLNFNVLSTARYESTQLDFRRHVQMLIETKKDLDIVFKRIRLVRDHVRAVSRLTSYIVYISLID